MEQNLEQMVIPEHVAVILDGNGRWAKRRGVPRAMGHKQGCVTLEQVVEDAARMESAILPYTDFPRRTGNVRKKKLVP